MPTYIPTTYDSYTDMPTAIPTGIPTPSHEVYLGYLAYIGQSQYSSYLHYYLDYAYAYSYDFSYMPPVDPTMYDAWPETTTTTPADYKIFVNIDALDKTIFIDYIREYDIYDIYLSKEFQEAISYNTTIYPNISITMYTYQHSTINWYVSNAIDGSGRHTSDTIHFTVGDRPVFIYTDVNDMNCKTISIHPISEEFIDRTTTTAYPTTTTTMYPTTTTTTSEYPTTTSSTTTTSEYPTTTSSTTTTSIYPTTTPAPPAYIEITDEYVKVSRRALEEKRGKFLI